MLSPNEKTPPTPIFNQTIINIESDLFKIHDRQVARLRKKWIRESKKPLMEVQGITSDFAKYASLKFLQNIPSEWYLNKLNVDANFAIKLIEDIGILIYQLSKSQSYADICVGIATYLKLRGGRSLIFDSTLKICKFKFCEIFSLSELNAQSDDIDQNSSSVLDKIFGVCKKALGNFQEIRNSPLFEKLYTFCMYMLGLSVFDKVGLSMDNLCFSKFAQECIKKKYHLGIDFIYSMMDTLYFLCERGYQCIKTGSLDPIYHSGSSYEKWFSKTVDLKQKSTLLNDPEAHGFTESGFLRDLDDVIEQGESIYQHATRIGHMERSSVRNYVNDLKMIRSNELSSRKAREGRDAPFGILVSGNSSVGKSTIINILYNHFAKVRGLKNDDCFKYTKNPTANFWDGFKTSMWCLVLDDVGYLHPNCATSGDPSVMEIIQIMNNVAYVPDQASLSDKGRTPLRCKLCIATTNTIHLNAQFYFACPIAVRRRMPNILDMKVKPEYSTESGMLDHTKAITTPGEYPNFWIWTIRKIVQTSDKTCKDEIVHSFSEIKDFLMWYNRAIINFEAMQSLVKESNNTFKDMQLCACNLPVSMCNCLTAESYDEELIPINNEIGELESLITQYEQSLEGQIDPELRYHIKDKLDTHYGKLSHLKALRNREVELIKIAMLDDLVNKKAILAKREIDAKCAAKAQLEKEDKEIDELLKNIEYKQNALSWKESTSNVLLRAWSHVPFLAALLNFIYAYAPEFVSQLLANLAKHVVKTSTKDALYWKTLGDKVYHRIGGNKTLALISGAIVTLLGAYGVTKMVTSRQKKPQGRDNGRPDGVQDEKSNVWTNKAFQLTPFDVPMQSVGYKSFVGTFENKVASNMYKFTCTYEKEGKMVVRPGTMMRVRGQVFMCNNHTLPEIQSLELVMTRTHRNQGVNTNTQVLLNASQILRYPDNDMAFFVIKGLPPGNDLTPYFLEQSIGGSHTGNYIIRNETGDITKSVIENVKYTDKPLHEWLKPQQGTFVGKSQILTKNGDCGSPLIVNTGYGPAIFGVHCLGSATKVVAATFVPRALVLAACTSLDSVFVVPGEPKLNAEGIERSLGEVHYKSPFMFIEEGFAEVHGSFQGFRARRKSAVTKSLICEQLQKDGFVLKYTAPKLSGWEPWYLAAKDLVLPINALQPAIFAECVKSLSKHFIDNIPSSDLSQVMVYDLKTAVNGYPGTKYVDSINRSSSAGAPFSKSKKYYFHSCDGEDIWQDAIMPNEEIQDRVTNILDLYAKGQRYHPVFTGSVKDEPLTFKKALINKVRIFSGAPVDWCLVVRMYLLSVTRLIQNNRFIFMSMPGVNCHSLEWEQIFNYLNVHPNKFAGDYGKFDKRMPPIAVLGAFEILEDICRAAGFTDEQVLVIKCIAYDTAFAMTDFDGTLVSFMGGNPSGNPLTVIINCLVNILYLMYSYYILNPEHECESFFKNVNAVTYGDDGAISVSECAPWYNHTTVSEMLAGAGITYTMADKEAKSIPYIPIEEISFLKRVFVWDEDIGAIVCPLEIESIEKMLMINVKSKSIDSKAQCMATIDSALREYFYHGKVMFNEKRTYLMSLVKMFELENYVEAHTFPAWGYLKQQFWLSSTGLIVPRKINNAFVNNANGPLELCLNQEVPSVSSYCSSAINYVFNVDERVDSHFNPHGRSPKSLLRESVGWSEEGKHNFAMEGVSHSVVNRLGNQLNKDSQRKTKTTQNIFRSAQNKGRNDWDILQTKANMLKNCTCSQCIREILCAQSEDIPVPAAYESELSWEQISHIRGDEPESQELAAYCELFKITLDPAERFRRSVLRYDATRIKDIFDDLDLFLDAPLCPFEIQSTDVSAEVAMVAGNGNTVALQQEVVAFHDENLGEVAGMAATFDAAAAADDVSANTELGEFLSRPVSILNYVWNESDAVNTVHTVNPWLIYFSDARIKNKLNNYAYIRCNLKIKVLINASPFYYGATLMHYLPMSSTITGTTVSGSNGEFIPYSQRPHCWIYPQNNAGCEMTLPYFNYRNYIDVVTATRFTSMGTLSFVNYTGLQSANGAVGTGVTVQVYAWAEDVKVFGPTVGLALQAVDEYITNPVSAVSSAVASALGKLSRVPIIGKYATATSIGVQGISDGIKTLGYTNTPVIGDTEGFRPCAAPPLATTENGYGYEKLTVDNKNELCVDNACVGLPSEDEFNIAKICEHESYITTATWASTNVTDDILFSSLVTPNLSVTAAIAGATVTHSTPMSHVGNLFTAWRGPIAFRFRFIASAFHKGRVRITFDPSGVAGNNVISDVQSSAVAYTEIIDLGKDSDVEFIVPYMQALPWLQISSYNPSAHSTSLTPTFAHNTLLDNGTIVLRVLTALSAPVATSSINILVFARAAPGFEFANPCNLPGTSSFFAPQSEDVIQVTAGQVLRAAPERYLINMGEAIVSLRQILRRMVQVETRGLTTNVTNTFVNTKIIRGKMPVCYGYDVAGIDRADQIVGVGTNIPFNWTYLHPVTWVSNMFIGYRGSMNWYVNVESSAPISSIKFCRIPETNATYALSTASHTYASANKTTAFFKTNMTNSFGGAAITNQLTQAGLTYNHPNYSQYKFSLTAPGNASQLPSTGGQGYDAGFLEIRQSGTVGALTLNTKINSYCGIGTDFSCQFFINAPCHYDYTSTPNAT